MLSKSDLDTVHKILLDNYDRDLRAVINYGTMKRGSGSQEISSFQVSQGTGFRLVLHNNF